MHDDDRIPPELDPAYEQFDDDRPSRTLANRMRPLIWLVAAVTLVALAVYLWP